MPEQHCIPSSLETRPKKVINITPQTTGGLARWPQMPLKLDKLIKGIISQPVSDYACGSASYITKAIKVSLRGLAVARCDYMVGVASEEC